MQSQTRFVFKQSFIYGAGNILTKLSGVLLIPLYLKYINETEFGVVALFETIFQFILILSGWGVKGGFMRWYHDMPGKRNRQRLFFTTWVFNSVTSLLSVVLIGVFLFWFSGEIFKYDVPAEVLIFFLAGSFSRLLYEIPFYLLKLEQRSVAQTGWVSLNIFLVLGFTFYFLEVRQMGLQGIYLAQMLAHGLTFVFLIPFIIKNMYPIFNNYVLKQMVKYGLPLAVSNILTTVLTLSDRHIINQYQNLDEVAGFSMAFKIANLLQMIAVAALLTSYSNYFFKTLHQKDNMLFFSRFSKIFVLLLSFFGLGVILFSPEIMYLISSGSDFFQQSVFLVPILILGLMFSGWRQLLTLPLNKHKKTRKISIILVFSAVINIVVNLLVVPQYGKTGASISTVIAQFVALVWFLVEVKKIETILLQISKIVVLFAFWMVIVVIGLYTFDLPLLLSWAVKVSLLIMFAGSMIITKMIGKEEVGLLVKFLRKSSR